MTQLTVSEQYKAGVKATCSGAFDFLYALESLEISSGEFAYALRYFESNPDFNLFPVHTQDDKVR